MSEQIDRHEMAIRYLLGDLPEPDKARLEEQFFFDESNFEELEIAEDELIDRYLKNELSKKDRKSFEKLLVSSRLVERVELARILAKKIPARPEPQNVVEPRPVAPVSPDGSEISWWRNLFGTSGTATSVLRPVLAASLILAILPSIALMFVWMKWRNESRQLAEEQRQQEGLNRKIKEEQTRSGELEARLNQTRREKEEQEKLATKYQQLLEELQREAHSVTLSFTLLPGSIRGPSDSRNLVEISRNVSAVNLDLDVEAGEYARYNAYVQDVETNTISRHPLLKPASNRGRKYIRCHVAAKILRPGVYNVHVEGITASGEPENFEDYPFRVGAR